MEQENPFLFKLVMVGDSKVGKSSLILKMTTNEFSEFLNTTGLDIKLLNFSHDDGKRTSQVKLWDTTGREYFRAIVQSFYKGCNGMIFVFDVTYRETFENLHKWHENAQVTLGKGTQKLLIGNKIDIVSIDRKVTQEEAKEFAEKNGMTYFEASARNNSREELLIPIKEMVERLIADQKAAYDNGDDGTVKLQKFGFQHTWRCF